MQRILITGANGFVGRYLTRVLANAGYKVTGSVRDAATTLIDCSAAAVGHIDAGTDWSGALSGIDCVVHLAARLHVAHETAADDLAALRVINVDGSVNLAKQAAACGVKRFVYLSSIKVNGEKTTDLPFHANDPVRPEDPYALSKSEAEEALRGISEATGMEVIIIRSPLIYGPGVKGNLLRLLRLVELGLPLPLGCIQNARSLVGIGNLCDLIRVCIAHPDAAGEVFLAADGEDLSTPQLLKYLASALNQPLRLLPVPVPLLQALGKFFGAGAAVARLTGDLRVDIGKSRQLLGWNPPFPVADGIKMMAEAYKNNKR